MAEQRKRVAAARVAAGPSHTHWFTTVPTIRRSRIVTAVASLAILSGWYAGIPAGANLPSMDQFFGDRGISRTGAHAGVVFRAGGSASCPACHQELDSSRARI